ncbi:unnamed protein product [Macrosiphum euphorbiae]|uniref:Uncharacterized protein n=1 Tax=Macrosiphum euphorbiae TaxID=13131 RepID=A0AAV0X6E9_9HEMI|nr:unnamed protein product [Macrosiphum euphorbiae]
MATIKVVVPGKNNKATSSVKGTANNATAKTSIGGTAVAQVVIISNVEKVTENQTNGNQSMKKQNHKNRKLLIKPVSRKCRDGYIITSSGDCKPIFQDE